MNDFQRGSRFVFSSKHRAQCVSSISRKLSSINELDFGASICSWAPSHLLSLELMNRSKLLTFPLTSWGKWSRKRQNDWINNDLNSGLPDTMVYSFICYPISSLFSSWVMSLSMRKHYLLVLSPLRIPLWLTTLERAVLGQWESQRKPLTCHFWCSPGDSSGGLAPLPCSKQTQKPSIGAIIECSKRGSTIQGEGGDAESLAIFILCHHEVSYN